ncbi:MAG: GNAT family N-acetyltransferase [Proteobacteria bacterium]|nr:GNAT family N-acetyltransferase [Pseudomonadota bacterium]
MDCIKVRDKKQIITVAQLAKEIWEEYYPTIITQEQIHYMINTFQSTEAIENQIQEGMQYYLAVSGEDEIGYLAYAAEKDCSLFLSKIYIKRNFRNRGKGREMFAFILGQAQKQKLKTIRLTVNKNNTASVEKYLKMGFSITDSVVKNIGTGFYMDDYVMAYEV